MKTFTAEDKARLEELTGGPQVGPKGFLLGAALGIAAWALISYVLYLYFIGS